MTTLYARRFVTVGLRASIIASALLYQATLAVAADAATASVQRFPAVIDCSVNSDALCTNALPPGVKTYSVQEALDKRTLCVKGDLRACYELCRRRLNGSRPGYACPRVINVNEFRSDLVVTDGSFACDTLQDEKRAQMLDLRDDDSRSFKKWMAMKGNSCVIVHGNVEALKIKAARDEFYLVALRTEHGRQRWVEGLFLTEAASSQN